MNKDQLLLDATLNVAVATVLKTELTLKPSSTMFTGPILQTDSNEFRSDLSLKPKTIRYIHSWPGTPAVALGIEASPFDSMVGRPQWCKANFSRHDISSKSPLSSS
jgi:CDP-glycerol glycerophosphotransferase (TagB/SpsB family)